MPCFGRWPQRKGKVRVAIRANALVLGLMTCLFAGWLPLSVSSQTPPLSLLPCALEPSGTVITDSSYVVRIANLSNYEHDCFNQSGTTTGATVAVFTLSHWHLHNTSSLTIPLREIVRVLAANATVETLRLLVDASSMRNGSRLVVLGNATSDDAAAMLAPSQKIQVVVSQLNGSDSTVEVNGSLPPRTTVVLRESTLHVSNPTSMPVVLQRGSCGDDGSALFLWRSFALLILYDLFLEDHAELRVESVSLQANNLFEPQADVDVAALVGVWGPQLRLVANSSVIFSNLTLLAQLGDADRDGSGNAAIPIRRSGMFSIGNYSGMNVSILSGSMLQWSQLQVKASSLPLIASSEPPLAETTSGLGVTHCSLQHPTTKDWFLHGERSQLDISRVTAEFVGLNCSFAVRLGAHMYFRSNMRIQHVAVTWTRSTPPVLPLNQGASAVVFSLRSIYTTDHSNVEISHIDINLRNVFFAAPTASAMHMQAVFCIHKSLTLRRSEMHLSNVTATLDAVAQRNWLLAVLDAIFMSGGSLLAVRHSTGNNATLRLADVQVSDRGTILLASVHVAIGTRVNTYDDHEATSAVFIGSLTMLPFGALIVRDSILRSTADALATSPTPTAVGLILSGVQLNAFCNITIERSALHGDHVGLGVAQGTVSFWSFVFNSSLIVTDCNISGGLDLRPQSWELVQGSFVWIADTTIASSSSSAKALRVRGLQLVAHSSMTLHQVTLHGSLLWEAHASSGVVSVSLRQSSLVLQSVSIAAPLGTCIEFNELLHADKGSSVVIRNSSLGPCSVAMFAPNITVSDRSSLTLFSTSMRADLFCLHVSGSVNVSAESVLQLLNLPMSSEGHGVHIGTFGFWSIPHALTVSDGSLVAFETVVVQSNSSAWLSTGVAAVNQSHIRFNNTAWSGAQVTQSVMFFGAVPGAVGGTVVVNRSSVSFHNLRLTTCHSCKKSLTGSRPQMPLIISNKYVKSQSLMIFSGIFIEELNSFVTSSWVGGEHLTCLDHSAIHIHNAFNFSFWVSTMTVEGSSVFVVTSVVVGRSSEVRFRMEDAIVLTGNSTIELRDWLVPENVTLDLGVITVRESSQLIIRSLFVSNVGRFSFKSLDVSDASQVQLRDVEMYCVNFCVIVIDTLFSISEWSLSGGSQLVLSQLRWTMKGRPTDTVELWVPLRIPKLWVHGSGSRFDVVNSTISEDRSRVIVISQMYVGFSATVSFLDLFLSCNAGVTASRACLQIGEPLVEHGGTLSLKHIAVTMAGENPTSSAIALGGVVSSSMLQIRNASVRIEHSTLHAGGVGLLFGSASTLSLDFHARLVVQWCHISGFNKSISVSARRVEIRNNSSVAVSDCAVAGALSIFVSTAMVVAVGSGIAVQRMDSMHGGFVVVTGESSGEGLIIESGSYFCVADWIVAGSPSLLLGGGGSSYFIALCRSSSAVLRDTSTMRIANISIVNTTVDISHLTAVTLGHMFVFSASTVTLENATIVLTACIATAVSFRDVLVADGSNVTVAYLSLQTSSGSDLDAPLESIALGRLAVQSLSHVLLSHLRLHPRGVILHEGGTVSEQSSLVFISVHVMPWWNVVVVASHGRRSHGLLLVIPFDGFLSVDKGASVVLQECIGQGMQLNDLLLRNGSTLYVSNFSVQEEAFFPAGDVLACNPGTAPLAALYFGSSATVVDNSSLVFYFVNLSASCAGTESAMVVELNVAIDQASLLAFDSVIMDSDSESLFIGEMFAISRGSTVRISQSIFPKKAHFSTMRVSVSSHLSVTDTATAAFIFSNLVDVTQGSRLLYRNVTMATSALGGGAVEPSAAAFLSATVMLAVTLSSTVELQHLNCSRHTAIRLEQYLHISSNSTVSLHHFIVGNAVAVIQVQRATTISVNGELKCFEWVSDVTNAPSTVVVRTEDVVGLVDLGITTTLASGASVHLASMQRVMRFYGESGTAASVSVFLQRGNMALQTNASFVVENITQRHSSSGALTVPSLVIVGGTVTLLNSSVWVIRNATVVYDTDLLNQTLGSLVRLNGNVTVSFGSTMSVVRCNFSMVAASAAPQGTTLGGNATAVVYLGGFVTVDIEGQLLLQDLTIHAGKTLGGALHVRRRLSVGAGALWILQRARITFSRGQLAAEFSSVASSAVVFNDIEIRNGGSVFWEAIHLTGNGAMRVQTLWMDFLPLALSGRSVFTVSRFVGSVVGSGDDLANGCGVLCFSKIQLDGVSSVVSILDSLFEWIPSGPAAGSSLVLGNVTLRGNSALRVLHNELRVTSATTTRGELSCVEGGAMMVLENTAQLNVSNNSCTSSSGIWGAASGEITITPPAAFTAFCNTWNGKVGSVQGLPTVAATSPPYACRGAAELRSVTMSASLRGTATTHLDITEPTPSVSVSCDVSLEVITVPSGSPIPLSALHTSGVVINISSASMSPLFRSSFCRSLGNANGDMERVVSEEGVSITGYPVVYVADVTLPEVGAAGGDVCRWIALTLRSSQWSERPAVSAVRVTFTNVSSTFDCSNGMVVAPFVVVTFINAGGPFAAQQRAADIATTVAAIPAAAMSSAGGAAAMQRALLQLKLLRCDATFDEDLDVSSSPLRLKFGPRNGESIRGSVIGNVVLLVLLCVIIVLLVCIRRAVVLARDGREVSMWRCAASLAMPGWLIAPFSFLLQPLISSSIVCLGHSGSLGGGADIAVGLLGLGSTLVPISLVVYRTTAGFHAEPRRFDPALIRRRLHETNRRLPECVAVVLLHLHPTFEWRDTRDRRSEHFTKHYGPVFDAFVPRRQWWAVVELVVAVAAGVLDGMVSDDAIVCFRLTIALGVLNAVLLMLLLSLRPCNSKAEFALSLITCSVSLIWVVLVLVSLDSAAAVVAIVQVWLGVLALALLVIQAFFTGRAARAFHFLLSILSFVFKVHATHSETSPNSLSSRRKILVHPTIPTPVVRFVNDAARNGAATSSISRVVHDRNDALAARLQQQVMRCIPHAAVVGQAAALDHLILLAAAISRHHPHHPTEATYNKL